MRYVRVPRMHPNWKLYFIIFYHSQDGHCRAGEIAFYILYVIQKQKKVEKFHTKRTKKVLKILQNMQSAAGSVKDLILSAGQLPKLLHYSSK